MVTSIELLVKQCKSEGIHGASTTRAMLDAKVEIKPMKRSNAVEVENSEHKFRGALDEMGLLEIAEGEKEGSIEDEKRLNRAVMRWVGNDESVVASI